MSASSAHKGPDGTRSSVAKALVEAVGRAPGVASFEAGDPISRALESIRIHLGMDVAFIAELSGARKTFHHVNMRDGRAPLHAGLSVPVEDGYCKKVLDGVLPGLIVDAAAIPEARAIPETFSVPIGSHLSVPLRLSCGAVYGTLCCFSFEPDHSVNERDLALLSAFADVLACQIEGQTLDRRSRAERRERLAEAMRQRDPAIVYQPIFKTFDMSMAGVEALARFASEPKRTPDLWFAEASDVGMRVALERQAIRNAIDGFRDVWKTQSLDLSLNCSPQTIVEGELRRLFRGAPPERLILEITEHDHVADYGQLLAEIARLREMGVRIAVDDAGSGYASMRHIIHVAPDYIKLDISLTRGIEGDRMRQALASSLIEFSHQTGCQTVAEGVETSAELVTLRNLGVDKAQGYYLSRPIAAEGVIDFATGAVVSMAERIAWDGEDLAASVDDSLCA